MFNYIDVFLWSKIWSAKLSSWPAICLSWAATQWASITVFFFFNLFALLFNWLFLSLDSSLKCHNPCFPFYKLLLVFSTGLSLSFEVGGHLQESSWAENYTWSEFLYVQFESRQVLTLVYPGTGTRVPPCNENPASANCMAIAVSSNLVAFFGSLSVSFLAVLGGFAGLFPFEFLFKSLKIK